MREPVYCNGEVIEYDHPGIILTRETINGFSFFIVIVWFRIVVTRVVAIGIITIGTIITGTIVTRDIVLLVVIDFFNERTRDVTSRGSTFPSREASELRDGGRGVPSASKGAKSSGTTSVGSCDGFGGICASTSE